LEWLNFSGCYELADLGPLASLPSLRHLNIADCFNIDGLPPFGRLQATLEFLEASEYTGMSNRSGIRNIERFERLRTLRLMRYSYVVVPDRTSGSFTRRALELVYRTAPSVRRGYAALPPGFLAIARLTSLEILDLPGWEHEPTLDLLFDGLTSLQNLSLWGWRDLEDIAPLGELVTLRRLNLGFCRSITNLAPLRKLTNLETLSLIGCNKVIDCTPLSGLENLKISGESM
jgi:Leucine-rich repeat (LRR) protein